MKHGSDPQSSNIAKPAAIGKPHSRRDQDPLQACRESSCRFHADCNPGEGELSGSGSGSSSRRGSNVGAHVHPAIVSPVPGPELLLSRSSLSSGLG